MCSTQIYSKQKRIYSEWFYSGVDLLGAGNALFQEKCSPYSREGGSIYGTGSKNTDFSVSGPYRTGSGLRPAVLVIFCTLCKKSISVSKKNV